MPERLFPVKQGKPYSFGMKSLQISVMSPKNQGKYIKIRGNPPGILGNPSKTPVMSLKILVRPFKNVFKAL
jgi:hypothetical protein